MALPLAIRRHHFGQCRMTAAAVVASGDVVQLPNGKAGVYTGLASIAIGEEFMVDYVGHWDLPCGSSVTATAGADAFWHVANKTVVVAAGAGIIYLGKFTVAKTSGQTRATVEFDQTIDPA